MKVRERARERLWGLLCCLAFVGSGSCSPAGLSPNAASATMSTIDRRAARLRWPPPLRPGPAASTLPFRPPPPPRAPDEADASLPALVGLAGPLTSTVTLRWSAAAAVVEEARLLLVAASFLIPRTCTRLTIVAGACLGSESRSGGLVKKMQYGSEPPPTSMSIRLDNTV